MKNTKKMKKQILAIMLFSSALAYAQVGVDTEAPKATLDVTGRPADASKIDGLIAPRLKGSELKAKDGLYGTDQNAALVYVTEALAASDTSAKTVNVTSVGYYYFDGSIWQKLNTGSGGVTGGAEPWYNVATNLPADSNTQDIYQSGKVGIDTPNPTTKLDVNGDLRVRDIPISTSTNDIALVTDANGNVKQRLSSRKGIMRGYLNADFTSGTSGTAIYKILNWNEIDDPNDDFTPSTGLFVAPVSGLYRVIVTASIVSTNSYPVNYVIGIASSSNNQWIMRFTSGEGLIEGTVSPGSTYSYTGVVHLTAGQSCYFGASYYTKIIANPSGTTGTGLGTYFDIELIKSD